MHVHLDPLGGLAGDMFLAASIDADLVTPEELEEVLGRLGLGEITVDTEHLRRGAIVGTHLEFGGWPPEAESDHRHLSTILDLLDDADLDDAVRRRAAEMFRRLGRAESAIHGIDLEEVHFHECGALDSIFDFVGAAHVIEHAASTWSCGPLPMGRGTVETDHGTVPLPAPATADILEDLDTDPRDVEAELVTPTGATIAATLRDEAETFERPDGRLRGTGFGAGTSDLDAFSNVLRVVRIDPDDTADSHGEVAADGRREPVVRLVAEIDDMQPEMLADAADALLEAGALDVARQPVVMKKGRQGVRLAVLARPDRADRLAEEILRRTTTFGVRFEPAERIALDRDFEEVETPYGSVTCKVGRLDGEELQVSPEYDACAEAADRHDVPTSRVYEAARRALAARSE